MLVIRLGHEYQFSSGLACLLRQKLCKSYAVGGVRLLAVCPDTPCPQADMSSPPPCFSAPIRTWQAPSGCCIVRLVQFHLGWRATLAQR